MVAFVMDKNTMGVMGDQYDVRNILKRGIKIYKIGYTVRMSLPLGICFSHLPLIALGWMAKIICSPKEIIQRDNNINNSFISIFSQGLLEEKESRAIPNQPAF